MTTHFYNGCNFSKLFCYVSICILCTTCDIEEKNADIFIKNLKYYWVAAELEQSF